MNITLEAILAKIPIEQIIGSIETIRSNIMTVRKLNYDRACDYERVNQLLWRTYREGKYPNWLQQRWEYMHWQPYLHTEDLHRIALWEDAGELVAAVHYEDQPILGYFERAPGYDCLCDEMIAHGEANFRTEREGRTMMRFLANDFDAVLNAALTAHGYIKHPRSRECISMMYIPDPFPAIPLKEGFRLTDLSQDNDLTKLDRCLWRGFNHPGEPEPGGEVFRAQMQSIPNFNKKLNVMAVASNGAYVAYSGIWFDPYNLSGYVEPVATDPDYRRMGLANACVLECVRRVGAMGAKVAYVESEQDFYHTIGFETIAYRPVWEKILN